MIYINSVCLEELNKIWRLAKIMYLYRAKISTCYLSKPDDKNPVTSFVPQ